MGGETRVRCAIQLFQSSTPKASKRNIIKAKRPACRRGRTGGCVDGKPVGAILLACTVLWAAEATAPLGTYTAVERRHWAFQPRQQPSVPAFTGAEGAWVKN